VTATLRTLSQDPELVTKKYDNWQRLGEEGFVRGTAFELVSDIWQKKGCAEWARSTSRLSDDQDGSLQVAAEQVIFE
jgi:hypothetical protein